MDIVLTETEALRICEHFQYLIGKTYDIAPFADYIIQSITPLNVADDYFKVDLAVRKTLPFISHKVVPVSQLSVDFLDYLFIKQIPFDLKESHMVLINNQNNPEEFKAFS